MTALSLPEAFEFLLQPARYKVAYGGRGSGKSTAFATVLLLDGAKSPHRVLCLREFANSISESVHQLLSDIIASSPALSEHYEVQQTAIIGRNGTEFRFAGIRNNVSKLKSFEGCTRAWVEEAQTVSKASWDILIPTIRRDGSEIWVTMNPELDTDESYRRFILDKPADAIVRKVNWDQNPFFPAVLRAEMLALKTKSPDDWLHIWEGNPRSALEGAIYAKELRQAAEEGRICVVEATDAPVITAWDLGYSDMTSIWFAQRVGFEIRVIDYYQSRLEGLDHYVAEIERRGYRYERHYLPHDANQGQLAAGGKTVAAQLRQRGMPITVLPQLPVRAGMDALRTLFPRLWFDEARCADGVNSLRRYRYDIDQQTGQFSRQPLHDDASHGADALRQLAVALSDLPGRRTDTKPAPRPQFAGSTTGWMAL